MIIGRDLMGKLDLTADLKRQLPQQDGATVPMKEHRSLTGISTLISRKMCMMGMQTIGSDSTREATQGLLKNT